MIRVMMLATIFLFLPAPAQQEPVPVPPEIRFETTAEPRSFPAQDSPGVISLIESVGRAVEKARVEFGTIMKISDELDALVKQEKRAEARERQLELDLVGSLKGFLKGTIPEIREKISSGDLRGSVAGLRLPREQYDRMVDQGGCRGDFQTLDDAAGRVRFQFPRIVSRLEEALMALEQRAQVLEALLFYRDEVRASTELCATLEGFAESVHKVVDGIEGRKLAGVASIPSGVDGWLGPRTKEKMAELLGAPTKPPEETPQPPKEKK